MMHAYFVTGTCCAGKDYYINERWPEINTIHIGLLLKTLFKGTMEKVVQMSHRPSSPPSLDAFVYKVVRDCLMENKEDGDEISVVNGYPRHLDQLNDMEEICRVLGVEPHVVFVDAKRNVRLTRATFEDEGKNRARRVEHGEIEVFEVWGNIMEREDRYASITHIFGGENVTKESYAQGLLRGD